MSQATSTSRAPPKCLARPNSRRSHPPKLDSTRERNLRTDAGVPYVRTKQELKHKLNLFQNVSHCDFPLFVIGKDYKLNTFLR